MRIRRHANLDVAAGAAFFRPSLCVLNQSPWDVIPFSPDSPLQEDDPSQEQHHLAPISMFRPAELPVARAEEDEEEVGKRVMCAKRGGKGWRCGNEARKGGALCDHHAVLRQCYSSRPQPAAGKSRRRAAAKPGGGGGGSDYYYYSGFGPRWRKRRGKEPESGSEGHVPAPAMPSLSAADSRAAAAPATESGSGECSGGEGGRRRRRKPMKKRSLMSLL